MHRRSYRLSVRACSCLHEVPPSTHREVSRGRENASDSKSGATSSDLVYQWSLRLTIHQFPFFCTSSACSMASNNPQFWSNSPFMDFNSYDQPAESEHQSPTQLSYHNSHSDWSERGEGDHHITGNTFNPTFQSTTPYLSQLGSYGSSHGGPLPVQLQPLPLPFPGTNPTNVHPGDPFTKSNEGYHRRGDSFPSQQHTVFSNPTLAQISPPPALYHPGGQSYHHQGLPFSDVSSSENSPLDLFVGVSIHSRVPSQDGYVYSYSTHFVI